MGLRVVQAMTPEYWFQLSHETARSSGRMGESDCRGTMEAIAYTCWQIGKTVSRLGRIHPSWLRRHTMTPRTTMAVLETPEFWLQAASDAEHMAEQFQDEECSKAMLTVAASYKRIAQSISSLMRSPNSPRLPRS